jgi:hypothetical protein
MLKKGDSETTIFIKKVPKQARAKVKSFTKPAAPNPIDAAIEQVLRHRGQTPVRKVKL